MYQIHFPRLRSIASAPLISVLAALVVFSDAMSASAPSHNAELAALFSRRTLPEPVVPLTTTVSKKDCDALAATLDAFEKRSRGDDFSQLESYLRENPKSPWRLTAWLNLGLLEYRAGYFSRCIVSFHSAWEAGKGATEKRPKALADRAAGEYAKMLARLGRYPELKAFLGEVSGRRFIGPSTELMMAGLEGATNMETRPEVAFRCGPLALSRILASKGLPLWASPLISGSKSTMQGISLAEVAELSKQLGLNYQPARRSPGAHLILPCVIHWKVDHYAALLRKEGERYLSEDPTFENETWHSLEALENEASGYFLVPPGPLPEGWTAVSLAEAEKVFGKGDTTGPEPDPDPPDLPTPSDPPPGPSPSPSCGMAVSFFRIQLTSLQIEDTPVGYQPAYGPNAHFKVTYIQRDPTQPSNFNYSNLGPKWNFSWQSHIVDDPGNPANVSLVPIGGGRIKYTYNGSSGGYHNFGTQFDTYTQLRRPTGAVSYEVTNPDGSRDIYAQSNGSTVYPRKVFLSQRIDPSGNAISLTYDSQLRLVQFTDSLGQITALSYELSADVFKITKVTDPFGRFAVFSYDGLGRLIKIRDVIGIESSFAYEGSSDFINTLTTPYGTTRFTKTENGALRRLTATDPQGDTQVLETSGGSTAGIKPSEPVAPAGMLVTNNYLNYRNSFYWNKKQWKESPNDYSKAYNYHWLHDFNFSRMSHFLESEKAPLQSRIWYSYPGQTIGHAVGTQSTPAFVGRVIEGGTQLTQRSITTLGKLAREIDPLGRKTDYKYSANGIDLLAVTHSQGANTVTLANYSYNSQHRPLTYTDSAGQTTTYAWNPVGQITSVKNPKNETTTFTYYTTDVAGRQRKGRLEKVDGALAGSTDVVTSDYDATGNIARVTGPDGYVLNFAYDVLDRLARVTFPDGSYTETKYDRLDPLTSRDRLGRLTQSTHNSIRRLTSVKDPAQRKVQYDYCNCEDLDQLIDPMNRITRWRHDTAGRVTAKVYADGSTIKYDYEPLSGRLSTITDEKGQVKRRTYNLDDTLAGITYTHAEHVTPNVVFTYDTDFRRPKTMVDGIGSTLYAYHPIAPGRLGAGQLASVDGPLPNDTLTYTYDELGRNTAYAINGVGETRSFDPLGRLLSAVNPLGTFGYTYAGATSRMDKVTYPNGMTCQYNYHPLTGDFRLKDIIHTLPGNTLLSRHGYEYNAAGTITRWTQISPQAGLRRSWLCGYDAADQLTSVASQDPDTLATLPTGQYGYTYDPAGNRLTETIEGVTTTASFNALNQLTSLTTAGASTLPQQTYEWDAEDRLRAINYTGTNQRTELEYDGSGMRLGVRQKQGQTVTNYRRFTWNGFQMAEERDSSGAGVQKRYFARGMQISLSGGSLTGRLFASDHLGSVRDITSATNDVTNSIDFEPWGRRSIPAAESDESSFGFARHWFHDKSMFSMTPYRTYNADLGRWLNRDPITEDGDLNLYEYVGNNPINRIDRLGLWWEKAAFWLIEKSVAAAQRKLIKGAAKGVTDRVDRHWSERFWCATSFTCGAGIPDDEAELKDRDNWMREQGRKKEQERRDQNRRDCKQKWDRFSDPDSSPFDAYDPYSNSYEPYNPGHYPLGLE